jgi:predicted ATPase
VLDNFEHLLGAAPFVADVLANCPHMSVLVTSRMPLRVRAEQVFPLAPLGQNDAVSLFCERARGVRPDGTYALDEVVVICERLDCLPLAIELAAMHVKVLALPELVERLVHRVKLLRGGPRDLPARQQTMEDALAWSYELLTASQQRCFRALSVFVVGWTLEAAEAVCWDEGESTPEEAIQILAALVDACLIQMELSAENAPRFVMLELIRDYALDRLGAVVEEEQYRQRHASYYARLGETIVPFGPGQGVIEAQLVKESPNARAALQWAIEKREVTIGLRLACAFGKFWFSRGHMHEAEMWFERVLALDKQADEQDVPLERRAEVLFHLGLILLSNGKKERAEALAREALECAKRIGDHSGMSVAFSILGQIAQTNRKLDEAALYFTESDVHARLTGVWSIRGAALNNLVELAQMQGDLVRATLILEEGLELARTLGIAWIIAMNTTILGHLARQQQNYALAKKRYRESLTLYRSFANPTFTARCVEGYAAVLCAEGHYMQATCLCAAAATLREQAQTPLPQDEHESFEQTIATIKAALDEQAFAREWAVGAALLHDEVIDYALSDACA